MHDDNYKFETEQSIKNKLQNDLLMKHNIE